MPVAVSSAIPKVPAPSVASTSSEVAPLRAISTSWITPAPLSASADTYPRSIRSTITGARPALMTWAPSPHTTGAGRARAAAMASTTAIRSRAASSFGSEESHALTPDPGAWARAKSSRVTLLARDANG